MLWQSLPCTLSDTFKYEDICRVYRKPCVVFESFWLLMLLYTELLYRLTQANVRHRHNRKNISSVKGGLKCLLSIYGLFWVHYLYRSNVVYVLTCLLNINAHLRVSFRRKCPVLKTSSMLALLSLVDCAFDCRTSSNLLRCFVARFPCFKCIVLIHMLLR